MLLDLHPELGVGGYGHGTVWVWSPDGTLLAVGSRVVQDADVRRLEALNDRMLPPVSERR